MGHNKNWREKGERERGKKLIKVGHGEAARKKMKYIFKQNTTKRTRGKEKLNPTVKI